MGTSTYFFFFLQVKLTVYGCDSYIMQLNIYPPPPKASPCFWPPLTSPSPVSQSPSQTGLRRPAERLGAATGWSTSHPPKPFWTLATLGPVRALGSRERRGNGEGSVSGFGVLGAPGSVWSRRRWETLPGGAKASAEARLWKRGAAARSVTERPRGHTAWPGPRSGAGTGETSAAPTATQRPGCCHAGFPRDLGPSPGRSARAGLGRALPRAGPESRREWLPSPGQTNHLNCFSEAGGGGWAASGQGLAFVTATTQGP